VSPKRVNSRGLYEAFGQWLDCAVVILAEGRIKTVFHCDERIRRDKAIRFRAPSRINQTGAAPLTNLVQLPVARDDLLRELGDPDGSDMPLEVAHADEVKKPGNDRRVAYSARPRHPRDEAKRALFPSPDFH